MNELLAAAQAARSRAHAPYSGFQVGVALRSASGAIYAGANVENASYPEGNCAEASAIAAMVAAGEQRIVEALVVAGGERLCTPCGGCRQRLAEFADASLLVHLCGLDGLRRTVTLGELLPLAFELTASSEAVPSAGEAPSPWPAAVAQIQARCDLRPRVGLILGSGLGSLADAIAVAQSLPYAELPGFPAPSVEGHGGRLILGHLAGLPVACLQGRVHLYEGIGTGPVNLLIRTLRGLGCTHLILTNAAGSLLPEIGPGSLVLIEDHINLLGTSPLIGPNDPAIGPRFPDMGEAYDPALRRRLRAVAERQGQPLPGGVYLATLGPAFETPAEIRAFRALGADLVGMSTVPEVISARHAGLRVAALSVVTNLAAGLAPEPLSHAQTLSAAEAASGALVRLLQGLFEELAKDGWTDD